MVLKKYQVPGTVPSGKPPKSEPNRTVPYHAVEKRYNSRAVRYDDIYRMDEIKSISFHIMFYRLYRGVAKYIVSGNTFSSFE